MTGINFTNETLSCEIQDDFPQVVPSGVVWIFADVNGTVVDDMITNGDNYMLSEDRLNLTILNVSNALEGNYTCMATNAAGSGSASIEFVVEGL